MYMCVVECVSHYLVHLLHSQQVLQRVPLPPTLGHLPPATLLDTLLDTLLATPHPKLATIHPRLDILLLPGTHHLRLGVTHTLLEDKYASVLQP